MRNEPAPRFAPGDKVQHRKTGMRLRILAHLPGMVTDNLYFFRKEDERQEPGRSTQTMTKQVLIDAEFDRVEAT